MGKIIVSVLLMLCFYFPITGALGEGEWSIPPSSERGTIPLSDMPIGASTIFPDDVTVTTDKPSGELNIPSGTEASRSSSGFSFSSINSADIERAHIEGGQQMFFGEDGSIHGEHIEQLQFSTPQGDASAEGVAGFALQPNGDFSMEAVEYVRVGDITITNGEHIISEGRTLTVGNSKGIEAFRTTASNIASFITSWDGTFTVASADIVVIDTIVFKDISHSTFTVDNGQLKSATVASAINSNAVTFPNPIDHSSDFVQIRYDEEEKFRIELGKEESGKEKIMIKPIDSIEVGFGERVSVIDPETGEEIGFDDRITFAPTEENSVFELIEEEWSVYRISHGQLNYTTSQFTETLDAHCGPSETAIHYDAGFVKVYLEPNVEILCPGGRYSYRDHGQKEKSYSILNTGNEIFELGLNKNNMLSDVLFLAGLHDDHSHGYVDFPVFLELWGIIEYDRFREFSPNIETREDYNSLNLPFQPVYEAFAAFNHALLNLRSGIEVDMRIDSPQLDPGKEHYSFSHSGAHRITERFFGQQILRFFDYNKQPVQPTPLVRYESRFLQEKPSMSIKGKTLDLRCPAAQNVTLYAEDSVVGDAFAEELSYLAGLTFDAYVKKYGGGIAIAEGGDE